MGRSMFVIFFFINIYLTIMNCCQSNEYVDGDSCSKVINIPVVTTYGNKTYYLELKNQINWFNAYIACKQFNMELVAIESDAEFDFLSAFVLRRMDKDQHIWTSAVDLGTEGEYYWMSTGRKICCNRWGKSQPDNALTAEHCAHLFNNAGIIQLNDNKCSTKMGFLCQSIKRNHCANHITLECQ